jgi:predicted transcriptional regulator
MDDAVRLTLIRKLAASGEARLIRESAGLSLTEAGAGAKVDRITIHRWEVAKRRPRGEAALRYLDLLEEVLEALGPADRRRIRAAAGDLQRLRQRQRSGETRAREARRRADPPELSRAQ